MVDRTETIYSVIRPMQTTINFKAHDIVLEGRLDRAAAANAAIITHPHPLYGGDMNNFVVSIIAGCYARKGWTTLRFNFRGTGNSGGQYEDGIGEQQDIQAAIDYLESQGVETIELAGYSFGAYVLANWSRNNSAHPFRLHLVSPPVAFMDFDLKTAIPGLKEVFSGQFDDIAPQALIQRAMPLWCPEARLHIIEGADHFFGSQVDLLQNELLDVIPSVQ